MRNVLLSGVGGQGTVLAAKVLAQAAQDKGWQVRTAETIGMAQRGGNVVSHVRMGDAGEEVFAPLLAEGTADLVIAFEPAEAARVLPFLAPDGLLVTATTAIQPVTAALSDKPYRADNVLASIERSLAAPARASSRWTMSRLPTRWAAAGVTRCCWQRSRRRAASRLDLDDLRRALEECVKPRFVALNLAAVDAVAAR